MTATKRPKAKREATLTLRLQQGVRAAIVAEADASSRSMSQVAETWLDEAQQGYAGLESMLGGVQVADAIKAMAELARRVEQKLGHPAESPHARAALVAGWTEIMNHAVPFIPMTPADDALADLREDARAALRSLNMALRELPEEAPTTPNQFGAKGLFGSAQNPSLLALFGLSPTNRQGLMELVRPYIYGEGLTDAVHVKLTDGLAAWLSERSECQAEAQAALDAVSAYSSALWNEIEGQAVSMGTGRDLAGAILSRRSIHNAAASLGKVTSGE